MKKRVALSNDDGGCDAAFSGGNSCIESARSNHQQITAILVTRMRAMSLRRVINTKDVRIFVTKLLLLQKCYIWLQVICGILVVQMRLEFDAYIVLHPITILTFLPFQDIT